MLLLIKTNSFKTYSQSTFSHCLKLDYETCVKYGTYSKVSTLSMLRTFDDIYNTFQEADFARSPLDGESKKSNMFI